MLSLAKHRGIKARMKMLKKSLISTALLICSSTVAFTQDAQATKKAPAYGDNPNLIKVLAVKTQEKVVDTAERVGAATERGIAKVKPSVEKTWDKTKTVTTDTAKTARDKTVQTVNKTKEVVLGQNHSSTVPIESGSLSQSTTTSPTTTYSSQTTTNIATPVAESFEDLPETSSTTSTVTETTVETQIIQQTPSQSSTQTDASLDGVPR